MKAYAFSLQGLLDARRAEEDSRRAELAAALQARAAREHRVGGLLAEAARARQVKRAVLDRATFVEDLLRAQRWLEAIERRVAAEQAELAREDENLARRRAAVVEATRRVRAMEKLDERRRAEWERAAQAEERRSWDERPRKEPA